MIRTDTQLKAKVRNLSGGDSKKAQTMIRNCLCDRFMTGNPLDAGVLTREDVTTLCADEFKLPAVKKKTQLTNGFLASRSDSCELPKQLTLDTERK